MVYSFSYLFFVFLLLSLVFHVQRMKASGIGRFFSPSAQNVSKVKSESKSDHPSSSPLSASAVVHSVADDVDSFFNTAGGPGKPPEFQPRINPADPGATRGETDTIDLPSSDTSNAAEIAELYVQQQHKQQQHATAATGSEQTIKTEASNKRKHEEEEKKVADESSIHTVPVTHHSSHETADIDLSAAQAAKKQKSHAAAMTTAAAHK